MHASEVSMPSRNDDRWWRPLTSTPLDASIDISLSGSMSSSARVHDKPLPALPPARTPSQVQHQRQNQLPYRSPHQRLLAHSRHVSVPLQPPPSPPRTAPRPLTPPNVAPPASQQLMSPSRPALDSANRPPLPRPLPNPIPAAGRSSHPMARPAYMGPPVLQQSLTAPVSPSPPPYASLFGQEVSRGSETGSGPTTAGPSSGRPSPSPLRAPSRPSPSTPSPSPRRDRASASPSPSPAAAKKGFVTLPSDRPALGQCWGIKRDGSRCTRSVRTACTAAAALTPATLSRLRPIVISDSDSEDDDSETEAIDPVYCHQHVKEINKTLGMHLPRSGRYLAYADYLTAISPSHAASLRIAMSDTLTVADQGEYGHLYIYELLDRSDAQSVCLKVGRSTKPMGRMAQWRSQCQSRKPALRALLPRAVNQTADQQPQGLVVGAHAVTHEGIRGSHRWEKLVHIDLADLCQRQTSNAPGAPGTDGGVPAGNHTVVGEICRDCKRRHREIFLVPRAKGGYETVLKICLKWQRFVQLVVRDMA